MLAFRCQKPRLKQSAVDSRSRQQGALKSRCQGPRLEQTAAVAGSGQQGPPSVRFPHKDWLLWWLELDGSGCHDVCPGGGGGWPEESWCWGNKLMRVWKSFALLSVQWNRIPLSFKVFFESDYCPIGDFRRWRPVEASHRSIVTLRSACCSAGAMAGGWIYLWRFLAVYENEEEERVRWLFIGMSAVQSVSTWHCGVQFSGNHHHPE